MLALLVGGMFACNETDRAGPPPATSAATSPAPAAPATTPSASLPTFFAGLAPGRYDAVHFRMMIPASAGEIQQRFTEAGQQHAQWMMAYAEEHASLPPGTPLPYHANFGISAAEYVQLLRAYEHMKAHEVERFDLTVKRVGAKLAFGVAGKHAYLAKLTLSPTGRLDFGNIVIDKPKRADALKGKFGTWSGYYWVHNGSSRAEGRLDTLAVDLGTVLATSRRFLRLQRKRSDGQAIVESHDLLLWIDPKPAHAGGR
ncbi:MAG: hypothetical protein JRI68_19305 [Deltaproteobacteria bacterium]|nr:hypothetical protein [Deltaproteobacteria bacterium]